jgi:hemoglobin
MEHNNVFINLKHEAITDIKSFSNCDPTQKFNPEGVKPVMIDFIYPEVPFPPKTIYKEFGEENIRKMVFHHHTLLKKSFLGHLFSQDEKMFEIVTNRTAEFFMEALGAPERYTSQYGHPHLRSRHFPFSIDEQARDIWLMFYKKTLKEVDFPKEYLKDFWEWIESLSLRMINRRTMMEAPKRYPYKDIAHEFEKGEKDEK